MKQVRLFKIKKNGGFYLLELGLSLPIVIIVAVSLFNFSSVMNAKKILDIVTDQGINYYSQVDDSLGSTEKLAITHARIQAAIATALPLGRPDCEDIRCYRIRINEDPATTTVEIEVDYYLTPLFSMMQPIKITSQRRAITEASWAAVKNAPVLMGTKCGVSNFPSCPSQ